MEKTSCKNGWTEYRTLYCQTAHTRIMSDNTVSLSKTKWESTLGNPSARSHW